MILQVLDGLVFDGGQPVVEKGVLDQTSSDGPRLKIGARDGDESHYSGGDEGIIGVVAFLSIYVLGNDEADVVPREGEVKARSTHGRAILLLKVSRDKVLRPGFAHGYVAPVFNPNVADVVIRALFKSDTHTADVGGGNLAGTEFKTLLDDRRAVWDVHGFAIIVNQDQNFGGHARC